MPSINSVAFCGNLTRQTHIYPCKNPETNYRTIHESSKNEIERSYDSKIEKLEACKQFTLKLDDMMYNDPDIQKAVSELPEGFEIEIANE